MTSTPIIGDPHVKTMTMNADEPQPVGVVWPWQKRMTGVQRHQSLSRRTGLPGRNKMPHDARGHLVTFLGEYVGTCTFLFFAFAGDQTAASLPDANLHGALIYSALAFGCSLAVNVWVFFRISGGLFNPAVALALALVGGISWVRAGVCFAAQMLGAMTAAGLVSALLPGFMVDTRLGGGVSIVQGLFLEMLLTAELVFTIFMLAAEKHRATFMAPIGIGMALFVAALAGGHYTGASLNPARSFGPAVVNRHFHSYHWIYWAGPALGALVAVLFYKAIKALEYEVANPGADDTASVHRARMEHASGLDGSFDSGNSTCVEEELSRGRHEDAPDNGEAMERSGGLNSDSRATTLI